MFTLFVLAVFVGAILIRPYQIDWDLATYNENVTAVNVTADNVNAEQVITTGNITNEVNQTWGVFNNGSCIVIGDLNRVSEC